MKPHKRGSLKAFVTHQKTPKKRRLAGGPGLTFAGTLKEKRAGDGTCLRRAGPRLGSAPGLPRWRYSAPFSNRRRHPWLH